MANAICGSHERGGLSRLNDYLDIAREGAQRFAISAGGFLRRRHKRVDEIRNPKSKSELLEHHAPEQAERGGGRRGLRSHRAVFATVRNHRQAGDTGLRALAAANVRVRGSLGGINLQNLDAVLTAGARALRGLGDPESDDVAAECRSSECNLVTMNKWQVLCPLAVIAIAVIAFTMVSGSNHHRYYVRAQTRMIGRELLAATNSVRLVPTDPFSGSGSRSFQLCAGVAEVVLVMRPHRLEMTACSRLFIQRDRRAFGIRCGRIRAREIMFGCVDVPESAGQAN